MADSTNLKLPYIAAAQAQKHVTHNEAIRALDAIVQLSVKDRDLATPPGAPTEGDRYIVAAPATGAWAGHAGDIAAYQDGAWSYYDPAEGWLTWVADEDVVLVFDGTGWIDPPSGATPSTLPLLGLNATADTTNRLVVAADASLFNHDGSGHQLKLNKSAAAATASILYQDGFSGRAEIGLTGNDDFHFKVSPDGSAWTDAIVIDRSTGLVSLTANSVTNAGLADMATTTLKGRATAGTGDPEDLTATQATALLNPMVGDSGSGGSKGLVPAPAAGDAAAAKFLKADGTWATPAGGGGGGEVNTASNVNAGGVGIFKQKTGVDLEFRGINAGSSKVSVALDAANNEIDIDVAEGNLTLANLGGTIDLGGAKASGTLAAARFPALTGDVTTTAGALAATIANNAVTNAKAGDMATATIKGRSSAGTGDPEDLTAAQARTILNVADGASANSSDATLLARANHTGSQAAATISDFAAAADARVSAGIATHEAAGDPHPQYLTPAEGNAAYSALGHTHPGLAPAGGTAGQVLKKIDGTDYNYGWQADAAGGGGGSGDVVGPASATDNALPRFDTTTGKLVQNSGVLVTDANEMDLPSVASPAAPTADRVRIYGKKFGNRMLPAFMGPSGLDSMMQPLLGFEKVGLFNPAGNSASVPGVFGLIAPTAVGTATSRVVASTSKFTRARRLGYVSATTAGSIAAMHFAALQFTTSDGAGAGGFFLCARFGVSDAATVSGARSFYGLRNVTSAPTNVEPSTLTNVIGIGNGAADTNLKVFYGGSAAQTPIDLGANFPANTLSTDLYELVLFAPPNALRTVHYQVTRLNTGDVATGSLSGTAAQVPSETTLLQAFCAWRSNNATALAVGIDIASVYIETDL